MQEIIEIENDANFDINQEDEWLNLIKGKFDKTQRMAQTYVKIVRIILTQVCMIIMKKTLRK